jgi:arginine-tRNA-protein transferase
MTEHGIYYPAEISGKQLDAFLAKGWYRMGQGIFTTNYVIQEDCFFRVYWLRYNLELLHIGKRPQQIIKRNKHFTTEIKQLHVYAELEELYRLYKASISFEPAESVQSWLFERQPYNIYDTYLVEIRDGDLLIAAGVFDEGQNAIAGILNFYHPAYKKYSLGKYLMLLKLEHALSTGKKWYYPGYIVKDYPKFDYKLFIDKGSAEIFLPGKDQWYTYDKDLLKEMDDLGR